MTDLLRRSRSLAVALAVLAISATVAFAAAPQARVSSPTQIAAEATETPEATETAEPTETPEATETAEPTETPEATETAEPSEAPKAPEADETASTEPKDTHGALVSTAARMATPVGFANHGAFVSCVAHLDVSVVGFDWETVTPEFCGAANPKAAQGRRQGRRQGRKGCGEGRKGRRQVCRGQGEGRRRPGRPRQGIPLIPVPRRGQLTR